MPEKPGNRYYVLSKVWYRIQADSATYLTGTGWFFSGKNMVTWCSCHHHLTFRWINAGITIVILPYISRPVGYRSTDKSWIFRRHKNTNSINLVGDQVHLATPRASEVPSLTPLVCVFSFIKLDARHHCHFSRQVLIFHVTLSLLPANINDASVIIACRDRRLSFRFGFSVRYLDNVPNIDTDYSVQNCRPRFVCSKLSL